MAEYIEREAAVKELDRKYGLLSGYHPQFYTGYQFAKKMMEQEPAADVAPVVHGYNTGRCRIFHCSECGYGVNDIFQEDEHNYPVGEFNYCPNCGARMEGEGKDNG